MNAKNMIVVCVCLATLICLASCSTPIRITKVADFPEVSADSVMILPEAPAGDQYELVGYISAKGYSLSEVQDEVAKAAAKMGAEVAFPIRNDSESALALANSGGTLLSTFSEYTFKAVRKSTN